MKREKKSVQTKNNIVEVSRNLFIKQGYTKTTIKQIQSKTGQTIGSIYHFFKNKEDILKQIAAAYLQDSNEIISSFLNDNDPIGQYIMTVYIQLKAIEINCNLTDLFYNSYNLWGISEMICQNNAKRNKVLFEKYNKGMTDDDWFTRSLAINGVLQNIIYEKLNIGQIPLKDRLRLMMQIAISLFNLPPEKIEPSISKVEKIMEKNRFKLYGVRI
jgi:AcrR family transcriptional regulator